MNYYQINKAIKDKKTMQFRDRTILQVGDGNIIFGDSTSYIATYDLENKQLTIIDQHGIFHEKKINFVNENQGREIIKMLEEIRNENFHVERREWTTYLVFNSGEKKEIEFKSTEITREGINVVSVDYLDIDKFKRTSMTLKINGEVTEIGEFWPPQAMKIEQAIIKYFGRSIVSELDAGSEYIAIRFDADYNIYISRCNGNEIKVSDNTGNVNIVPYQFKRYSDEYVRLEFRIDWKGKSNTVRIAIIVTLDNYEKIKRDIDKILNEKKVTVITITTKLL